MEADAGDRVPSGVSNPLLELISGILARCSFASASRLGARLGTLWYHLVPIRRRVVHGNLQIAFPEHKERHRTMAAAAFRSTGEGVLELMRMSRMSSAELLERVRVEGFDRYEAAAAQGKGVIVVTGHLANFDLLACSQAAAGIPLAIVSKDLHARGMNRFWMKTRRQFGVEILSERSGRQLLRWLRGGGVLGLVADQRTAADEGGLLVPFFGRDVWTSTAAARLARHTGAPLLPVRICRTGPGTFDVRIEEMLPVRDRDGVLLDNYAICVLINQRLEAWIRDRPADWLWLHRRFLNSGESCQTSLEKGNQ